MLPGPVEKTATLATFAGTDTSDLLAAEPVLVDAAELVIGCARAGAVPDAIWDGVERIVAGLLGPRHMATPLNVACMVVAAAPTGHASSAHARGSGGGREGAGRGGR